MPNPSSLLFVVEGKPSASYARLSLLRKSISFDVLNVDTRFSIAYDANKKNEWRFSQGGREFWITSTESKIVFFPRSFERLGTFSLVGKKHRNYDGRQWRAIWYYFEICTRDFACLNHPLKARVAANRLNLLRIADKASIPTAWTAVLGGDTPLGKLLTAPKTTPLIAKTLSDTNEISARSSAYPILFDEKKLSDIVNISPMLIQAKIHICNQFRVYIFGESFIVIKIFTNSQEIDFRFDEKSVETYEICRDEQVLFAMNCLLPLLDIDFGSIDFIHDGERLFLVDMYTYDIPLTVTAFEAGLRRL